MSPHQKIFDLLKHIEETFPINDWRINNIRIWPLIRLNLYSPLFHYILTEPYNNKKEKKQLIIYPLIKNTLLKIRSSVSNTRHKYIPLKKSKEDTFSIPSYNADILFYSMADGQLLLNGLLYNRMCDPLIEILDSLGYKSVLAESSYMFNPDGMLKTNKSFYNLNPYITFLKSQRGNHRKKSSAELFQYDEFERYLKIKLPGLKTESISKKDIISEFDFIQIATEHFDKLLKKNTFRFCFLNPYYHSIAIALILACKKNNIPTLDMQHGSQRHPAYSKWTNVPQSGYEMLPDYFWTWTDADSADINEWVKNTNHSSLPHKAITGGFPWLNQWLQTDRYKSYWEQADLIFSKFNLTKKILITLSNFEPNKFENDWLLNFIDTSPADWTWFIKFHPTQHQKAGILTEIIQQQTKRGIIDNQLNFDLPLPCTLKYIDIHVTEMSSVTTEADLLHVPTIVTNEDGLELFPDSEKRGVVKIAQNPIDLMAAIEYFLKNKTNITYNSLPEKSTIECTIKAYLN